MQTIRLPEAAKGMTDATVLRWLVEPGGPVEAGQVLVELETADSLLHVDAPVSGVLSRQTASPGTTVPVGGELGQMDGEVSAGEAAVSTPQSSSGGGQAALPDGAVAIAMPQAGNTMEEGTILSWKVAEGDTVSEGQILCEIETDKATMEYESPSAGTLARIVVGEGQTIAVKEPIAYLGDDAAAIDAYLAAAGGAVGSAPAAASGEAPSAAPAAAGPVGDVTPILMPQAGNTMEEGTILSWKVAEGDTISEGQILCEIETDKATMEFESPDAGRLAKIIVGEGQSVEVTAPIAVIADSDEDAEAFLASGAAAQPAAAAPAPAPAAAPAPAPAVATAAPATPKTNGRIKASPAARRIAAERGLDLASVGQGSGPGGRIISSDLADLKPAATKGGPAPKQIKPAPATALTGGGPSRSKMTKMRRAIAVNLQQSKQTIPHFYVRMTFNAQAAFDFYRASKPATGCTINDVIVLATGRVMHEFPAVRSQVVNDEVVEYPHANIGVAVGVPDGLVVPVVLNVDTLGLAEVAAQTKRVIEHAREGKLENIGKGNFTVSNMGMFGVEEFAAIINPPESGILAISALRETVLVENGAMRPGKVMTMTLSCDHRIVDGMTGALFLGRLKEVLENPEVLGGTMS